MITQANLFSAAGENPELLKALDDFSAKLSQSYEEVNLLFRMARLLTSGREPARVMTEACEEIRNVQGFGWTAFQFNTGADVHPDLAGKLFHSGSLPCTENHFSDLVNQLPKNQNNWERILLRDQNELAKLADSEVLTQLITHDKNIIGSLLLGSKTGDDPDITSNQLQFTEALAEFIGMFHENMTRFAHQQAMFMGTLRALTAAVDAKDPYTRGHSERVGLLARKLATQLGLDSAIIENHRIAGLVHDIGKIGVPEAVLCKPARLTDAEFEIIKQHPTTGYNILKDIPSMKNLLPGVLYHHERWDGKGYPHKLVGEKIPPLARVLALADTFDAMSSNRAYRSALSRETVLAELLKSGGTQFDPNLARIFVQMDFTDFDQLLTAEKSRAPIVELGVQPLRPAA